MCILSTTTIIHIHEIKNTKDGFRLVRKMQFNLQYDDLSTLEFVDKTSLTIDKRTTQIERSLEALAFICNCFACIKIYTFNHITLNLIHCGEMDVFFATFFRKIQCYLI